MTDKQPAHPQIAALITAAERVIDIFQEQICPLEDLAEAVENLKTVVNRTSGRPRTKGIAEAVARLQAEGKSVANIVEATGASERTVRRYYKKEQ